MRRALGYLPEAVPLPPEMRVREYLGFRAALKGIARGKRAAAAVDDAIDDRGPGRAAHADHRHAVARLPAAGRAGGRAAGAAADPDPRRADRRAWIPNQIRETHALIRELGRERAVLLSTHILPDVEALAGRVVILDRGRVKAAGHAGGAARAPAGGVAGRGVRQGDVVDATLATVRPRDPAPRVGGVLPDAGGLGGAGAVPGAAGRRVLDVRAVPGPPGRAAGRRDGVLLRRHDAVLDRAGAAGDGAADAASSPRSCAAGPSSRC